MSIVISRTLEFLLLPPGNLVPFLLLAIALYKWRGWMLAVLLLGVVQAIFFSLPVVADKLLGSLEKQYPPKAELWLKLPQPQAIVVLGAEQNPQAVEYGGSISGSTEMERLNYAAFLYQQTGLPILLSGGTTAGPDGKSEARYMQEVLKRMFNIPVKWLEDRSHTTWENAQYTDEILAQAGIQSAWVITQSWHMPRAMQAFANRQITYIPAPTTFGASNFWQHQWMWWIPQSTALNRSQIALHEWFGIMWYLLR